jgi:hypothetical protein
VEEEAHEEVEEEAPKDETEIQVVAASIDRPQLLEFACFRVSNQVISID